MQSLENGNVPERVKREICWCMTREEGKTCRGAGGRKLRQVCVYCDNYQKGEGEKHEKGD